ncbi:autotransporter-associated N-terminal domain-containing protein [Leptotrichia sp. OH3620_COT-345]|uniref:autotransporter-associated N-terminal domain-containing protein n=1 Tax=Leptotrichia sp. OH3620_COT-345 TaxID=2491048 RepID=UPI000F646D73|nr:autotransporter-associated N-terminal domain-containing protein [Leptotrichia sp. OH3620_COT-345]RRD41063.1 autotransporter-associated N-terminal domain-containing protein [Leptotrichia sp. OH3620_COT-345]
MANNLKNLEKVLKQFTKRNKNVKYTREFFLSFLLMGVFAFSDGLTSSQLKNTENNINRTRKELSTSIVDMKNMFRQAKIENNKLLRNANLELIQLMEEGDHVVKSPWSSWQFGIGYTYNKWKGTYKGENDKSKVYPYYGVYLRSNNLDRYIGRGNEFFFNLAKHIINPNNLYDLKSASSVMLDNRSINGEGFADLRILDELPLIANVNANVVPKEISRTPHSPMINPAQPPVIGAPTVNYSVNVSRPSAPGTAEIFNIDLGAYCNDMANNCLWQNEAFEGEAINQLTGIMEKYGFADFDGNGKYDNGYDGYAGYRHFNNDSPNIEGIYSESIYQTKSTSANGMTNNSQPSLIYSWNILSPTRKGQWRLFTTYLDVQADTNNPGTAVDLTVDTSHKISSINQLDNMPTNNFNPWIAGLVAGIGPLTNKNYEKYMNRPFNTQAFYVGGSRFATLDNVTGGGSIVNNATLSLEGPLTIGLEVQYDAIGAKTRKLENNGIISDKGEDVISFSRQNVNTSGDTNGNNEIDKGEKVFLDLGIYDWQADTNYDGHDRVESSSIREDTVKGGFGTAQLNITVASGRAKEFYRNAEGYIGGKVGLILTREDGEDNLGPDNKYRLANQSGTIDFRGNDSIGIQIYSPYSHVIKEPRPWEFRSEEINGMNFHVFEYLVEKKPVTVNVENKGTITTMGAKSYGIKISSGVDYKNSSVINDTGGVINVAGYDEDNEDKAGYSAGMAVLEDGKQSGKNYTEINLFGPIKGYIKPDGTVDPSITKTSPKPIVAGNMIQNKGTINIAGNNNSGMFLQTAFNDTFTSSGNISIKTNIINDTKYDDIAKGNVGIRIDSGIIQDNQTYIEVYRDNNTYQYTYVTYSAKGHPKNINGKIFDGIDTKGITTKLGTQKGINTSAAVIDIETGDKNVGMLASGGNAQVINEGTINIKDNDKTTENGNYGMATALKQSYIRNAGADGVLWTADDEIDYTEPSANANFYQIGYAENNGTININTVSKNNVGLLINSADNVTINGVSGINTKGTGKTGKTSKINIETEGNIGVANFGNFTMEGGEINAKGAGSVGIYTNYAHSNGTGNGASTTVIKEAVDGTKANIKVEGGAAALYAENSSNGVDKTTINIQNSDITVGAGGLLFYNYSNPVIPNIYRATGKINIIGAGVNALIKNNGLAFILKQNNNAAPYWNINDVLSNISGASGNKMTLKLEDGARLFLIDAGSNAVVSASDITNIKNTIALPNSGIAIDPASGNFKYITLKGGTFNINDDVALNSPNNVFAAIDYIASNVNILIGKTISNINNATNEGEKFANGDQYVIAQINPKSISGGGVSGDITVKNDGNIIIKENSTDGNIVGDTIAIVTDLGTVINNGTILNTTDNGVGILGTRSTIITNSGDITVGNNGTGIYGLNKLSGTEDGDINITSSGNIIATGNNTSAGYGIIALNKTAGRTSNVTVNSGKIDVSAKNGGAGIYVLNNGVTGNSTINVNGGKIISGKEGAGIVHINGTTNLGAVTIETIGDNSTGVYQKDGGTINLTGTTLKIGNKGAGVYAVNSNIVNNGITPTVIGNEAIAYAVENGTYSNPLAGAEAKLGSESIYIYARGNGRTAIVTNNTAISAEGSNNVALYGKDTANITNNSAINLNITNNTSETVEKGLQNVGILMTGNGGYALNTNNINIGISNKTTERYSIGMAAEGTNINLENNGTITVSGNRSIGMYGRGIGTVVRNNGTIILDASVASASNMIDGMTGIYVADGATGYNYGTIKTAGNYAGNSYIKGMTGVVIKDATFVNYNNIEINADESAGVYIKNGVIKNYGNMTITGNKSKGVILEGKNTTIDGQSISLTNGDVINGVNPHTGNIGTISADDKYASNISYDPSNRLGSVIIKGNPGIGLIGGVVINGIEQRIHDVAANIDAAGKNYYISNLGIYIDTLGRTNAIRGLNNLFNNPGRPIQNTENKVNIMFGAELADLTREKVIRVPAEIVSKIRRDYPEYSFGKSSFVSGAYHWIGSIDIGDPNNQNDDTFVMAKIPYTDYAKKGDKNIYNFLDGLEQRYSENEVNSPEKLYFNKLNAIGDGEAKLWAQAVDEALGRQYINARQRIYMTSSTLDKELDNLRNWRNGSKNINKIISFGNRDEYKTKSAQIHNHKSNAYGVAYINQRETVKKNDASGWYAGALHNTFKLKDIGSSEEKTLMLKVGIYKSIPFGNKKDNIWTISGEGFVGHSEMKRRFLNVDTIYEAQGNYTSYGIAMKNEFVKNIRLSERFTFTPYGSLKMEYGRHDDIKEKRGVLRLAIEDGKYFSIKPQAGVILTYKQPVAVKSTFVTSLGMSYEAELGKVTEGETKFRVNYTSAGSYRFKGEKDNKKGNFKTELNIGLENKNFGITINGGYDTKGKNIRGGIGFRAIY